jgi:hypothetical protein
MHGCEWEHDLIHGQAASSGNIETTAWVKQQPGVDFNAYAMHEAARMGHTAMCEYLYAEQCPWSHYTCNFAAEHGHVDTLRWLQEHNCPWEDEFVAHVAAQGGSIEVLAYLQQQGILATPAKLTSLLNIAGGNNHLAAAQWLRQQGAEWPARLHCFGNRWSGRTLAWARDERCWSPAG